MSAKHILEEEVGGSREEAVGLGSGRVNGIKQGQRVEDGEMTLVKCVRGSGRCLREEGESEKERSVCSPLRTL